MSKNLDLSPLEKAMGIKASVYQQPKWLQEINRQQQLMNDASGLSTLTARLGEYRTITDRMNLSASAMATSLNKYYINTGLIERNTALENMKKSLLSVTSLIEKTTPKSLEILNMGKIQSCETRTANILKLAGISTQVAMPSLQIANALKQFSGLSTDKVRTIDSVLASSSMLKNFSSLVQNQHGYIQRNTSNCEKHLKVIELASDLLQDHIETVSTYIENDTESIEIKEEKQPKTNTVVEYIPSYLGYVLREDSNYDIEEEFCKSMLFQILMGGKNIVNKIEKINNICTAKGKEKVFKTTTKGYSSVSIISTSFAANANTFGSVIDSLYMLLYEGSGDATRITEILSKENCTTLWDIKHLRTSFRHDVEHGKEKDISKKQILIGKAYESICGKVLPIKQKDWVTAHYKLFCNVNNFLDVLIEQILA